MTDRAAKFARNVALLLGAALAAVYFIVLAALAVYQRDILFIGARYAAVPMPEGMSYTVYKVRETDGISLVTWQLPPRAGMPTVVIFYGNGGRLFDFSVVGETLHRDGFGVVLASYRGYGGNPGKPTEAGLMDDARAILASLPKGPKVLWGQSLGTGVAARMAAEGRGQALILQSPYTAVVDVAARRFWGYPVRLVMRDRFDTLSVLDRIKMPVLILHGTNDETVPYDMGVTLAHRFGRQAAFFAIPGGTHNLDAGEVLPPAQAWLRHFLSRQAQ